MNTLFDALLNRPLTDVLIRLFLFILFTLHFLFVLFTIGTAIQSVFYFVRYRWQGGKNVKPVHQGASDGETEEGQPMPSSEMPNKEKLSPEEVKQPEKEYVWGKQILHTFLGIKSLAVALGVGALLLIELGLTVPFFTSISLLAPYWILIIAFLIIAFLTLDLIGQNWDIRPYVHLVMGIVGLIFLLAVPGIFVAALTTMEHPEYWQSIINNNYKLPSALSLHWLFRYGHVIGAALVFGGAFHYFFSKADQVTKRNEMLRWIVAGILIQFALGILLYASLPNRPGMLVNILIVIAIASASILLWMVAFRRPPVGGSVLPLRAGVPLLLLVLLPMLLTRQHLQDQGVLQVDQQVGQNAAAYREVLAQYSQQGLQAYEADLQTTYNDGQAIYMRSCAFCHGEQANGQGQEADRLQVPPEVLAAVRANPDYLYATLRTGVHGTGMPYFTYLTSHQADNLLGYLNNQYQILEKPSAPPNAPSQDAVKQARIEFSTTCVSCHGGDGKGATDLSITFAPPPPDLTQYSLTPQRAYDVITNGYPGTLMAPFGQLPEDVRWGLVQVVTGLRQ